MNKILRITAVAIVLFSNIVFASCQKKVFRRVLDKKNPIEFIYNSSIDSLRSIISKQLEINDLMVWDSQHGIMVSEEASKLFSQKGNSSDFCLQSLDFEKKSKIYISDDGDPFVYLAWYYLHLESIDETHAKVKITPIEPEIILGLELLPTPPHFVRRFKTMTVEPSTIEEYEILLEIGNLVGEKDMPPLILPNEKNKVELVKRKK